MTDWREAYLERYKLAKDQGKSFFPHAVFKDAVVSLLILGVLSFLAVHFGAPIEDLADPTDSTYNPRPEWYFLFLFQALKAFPGRLESVAACILPSAAILALLLVPLLDSGPKRHPLNRPLWTGLGLFAIAGFIALTVFGMRSPMLNPIQQRDPQVTRGGRLYAQLNCAYCHSIDGKGGKVGPKLDLAAGTQSGDWLKRHFRDPQSISPGTVMPKLNLLPDEIDALTAYVQSLGTGGPYTAEAPKLFAANCAVCHKVRGKGGEVGPDLSAIGSARDRAFLKNYITDPTKIKPDSSMPGFKGQMTDVQIEDMTRYLARLK